MKSKRVALGTIYSVPQDFLLIPAGPGLAWIANKALKDRQGNPLVVSVHRKSLLSESQSPWDCLVTSVDDSRLRVHPYDLDPRVEVPLTAEWRYVVK